MGRNAPRQAERGKKLSEFLTDMEAHKERLFEMLYKTFHLPLSKIKVLKDYYAHFNHVDISKLKMDFVIDKKGGA